jgi:hypothetical protein
MGLYRTDELTVRAQRTGPARSSLTGTIAVSGRSLRIPEGLSALLLSDEESAATVDAFVRASPDHTVYHRPPYIGFARERNGAADLVMLSSSGQPLVAFPFHPGPRRVSTGYAGVCLPNGHAALRRGLAAMSDLMRLNRGIRFQSLQSAQAPATDDIPRAGLLGCLVDGLEVRQDRLHTRLLRLPALDRQPQPPPSTISLDDSHESLMSGYDGSLRNQVRQASRHGVRARVVVPRDAAEAREVYSVFLPIHNASWRRTGMEPHPLGYLLGLDAAVRAAGGSDVVVLAQNAAGIAVAAVSCHVYADRAIYWSGCSLAEALPLRANSFCLHAAVLAAQWMGVRTFELGRFRPRETDAKELSVTSYKAGFGGEVQRVLNFEFGSPRLDVHAGARVGRDRVRRWLRQHRAVLKRSSS